MSVAIRDVTHHARDGWRAEAGEGNPYLFSSSAWCAWQVGRFLADTGKPMPDSAFVARGCKVRIGLTYYFVAKDGAVSVSTTPPT